MNKEELVQRLQSDLLDGYDEELEMELEDRNIDRLAQVMTEGGWLQ